MLCHGCNAVIVFCSRTDRLGLKQAKVAQAVQEMYVLAGKSTPLVRVLADTRISGMVTFCATGDVFSVGGAGILVPFESCSILVLSIGVVT